MRRARHRWLSDAVIPVVRVFARQRAGALNQDPVKKRVSNHLGHDGVQDFRRPLPWPKIGLIERLDRNNLNSRRLFNINLRGFHQFNESVGIGVSIRIEIARVCVIESNRWSHGDWLAGRILGRQGELIVK